MKRAVLEARLASGKCKGRRLGFGLAGGLLLEHVSTGAPSLCGSALALAGAFVLYEVAPAEHRLALMRHGLAPAPPKAKAS